MWFVAQPLVEENPVEQHHYYNIATIMSQQRVKKLLLLLTNPDKWKRIPIAKHPRFPRKIAVKTRNVCSLLCVTSSESHHISYRKSMEITLPVRFSFHHHRCHPHMRSSKSDHHSLAKPTKIKVEVIKLRNYV